ncbi:MAG: Gfo/Idh/MocA family oxidoreductase [Synechocystis sp.]|nr:Gfo/Idh/MocA family oxidoreductase [Synechocystis sp.]
MVTSINWGIIGTGKIAHDFAQGLRYVKRATLTAIASRQQEKAQHFATKFKIEKAYGSYEQLVNDPTIDIVYIATPHHRHKDDCCLALNAGKPVLCEKPFAMNALEAQTIVNLAREKQLFCMEAMWMRFLPLIQEIKTLIDQGMIGSVKYLKADFGYPVSNLSPNRFFDPNGGGALLDRGVYLISLALYLFGEPESIRSHAVIGKTGIDEQSSISLCYADGTQAILFSTLNTFADNEATFYGTKGRIKIGNPFYCPYFYSMDLLPSSENTALNQSEINSGINAKIKNVIQDFPLAKSIIFKAKQIKLNQQNRSLLRPYVGNGYNYEAEEVVRCLQNKQLESLIMPLDESVSIMKIMDQIRQSWSNN